MIWFLTIQGLIISWLVMMVGVFMFGGGIGEGDWKMTLGGYIIFSIGLTCIGWLST